MYIVIELQKANKDDSGAASIVNTYNDYNEAESRYYSILSYAALSQIFLHGAYLFSEDGHMIMNRQYVYEPEPEPQPTPEPTPEPEPEQDGELVEEAVEEVEEESEPITEEGE